MISGCICFEVYGFKRGMKSCFGAGVGVELLCS